MTHSKAHVDVAIVGGGIIGCAAAWYLTRRGLRVGLYEKGRIAGEQSGKNSGFVRKQGRDEREMALIVRSLELWRGINAEIGEETGFVSHGNLAVAADADALARMEAWLGIARAFGVDSRVLGAAELGKAFPRLRPGFAGGLFTRSDGQAEPTLAAPAIARALRGAGADVQENVVVEELIREGGRVTGLRTERGEVRAGTVIVAAGLWTRLFLSRYGVELPQSDLKVSVGRTAPFDHGLTVPAWTARTLVRPRHDGGLTISLGTMGPLDFEPTWRNLAPAPRFLPTFLANREATRIRLGGRFLEDRRWVATYTGARRDRYDEIRVPDVPPNVAVLDASRKAAAIDFTFPDPLELVESWACRIDVTPDAVPVLGSIPGLPGLVVATGMSGHGFGISLGVGEAIAELVATGRSAIPLDAFRIERFAERYFAAPQNVL